MGKRVKVPIRVKTATAEVSEATPPVVDREVTPTAPRRPRPTGPKPEPQPEVEPEEAEAEATEQDELEMWRDKALRLQAEMDNFRKRQRRLAEERVAAERENLLREFLAVADDLKRALSAEEGDAESLRQGVEMTYQSLLRVLKQAGAEMIEAAGQPFDPEWHEAVGTVPHEQADAPPDTVVEVLQDGFRIGDRLLRPARVIVAVKADS